MIFKKYFIFLILCLFAALCSSYADENNLNITSKKLVINNNGHTADFYGEVLVFFDDFILKTSELQILYNNISGKKTINKIIIPNKLSAFRAIPENIIIADSAEYFAQNSELVLIGNINLLHQGNIIQTDKLSYYTKFKKIDKANITD